MQTLRYMATSAFGLESVVKREAANMGFKDLKVSDGRVCFDAGLEALPKANLRFRCAERVLLVLGEFTALSFDDLFEGVKALPWEQWITKDGRIAVTGSSVQSRLYSVSDCQSIIKKAIVERLKLTYKTRWFDETGPEYKIRAALLRDVASITLDTSGAGLHKRGYRAVAGDAPLKETLAAALVSLSYWRKDRVLLDPVCGSGTICVEAAMIAKNIAPGLSRKFSAEEWPQIDSKLWKDARKEAYAAIDVNFRPEIYGSDIDERVIEIAKANASKAGVDDCARFERKPLEDVTLPKDYGVAICNPPYGERLGLSEEIEKLYKDMGGIFGANKTWSFYALTNCEYFEKLYGRRADAKRKIYNGGMKTDFYQFYGERPARGHLT
ncbi:MAG: class I SAM-dependent RNA methyltransferase [Clostridiales bacterium]|nr:class I SAM-dependent RNA methyltransferase [Clostridiales bacterium]